ncbi:AAA family ATPase [Bacteroides sp.]
MEITTKIKDRVIRQLFSEIERRKMSQAEFAKTIVMRHGIKFDKSVLSQIKNRDNRNYSVIKDSTWMALARYYRVMDECTWETVATKAYISVQAHLEKCQEFGMWQVLCDRAGIGKSYAAKEYERNHINVYYIDCSEHPGKSDFVKFLAGIFGLEKTGTIDQLWNAVTNELLLRDKPLLILDEFGDCAEAVISLMKGLYNKANVGGMMMLGCYFIGADNLEKRLQDGRRIKKRSYAEFWSRFNDRITGLNYDNQPKIFKQELRKEIEKIVDANLPEELVDMREEIIEKSLATNGVRAISNEIAIQKMLAQKRAQLNK